MLGTVSCIYLSIYDATLNIDKCYNTLLRLNRTTANVNKRRQSGNDDFSFNHTGGISKASLH